MELHEHDDLAERLSAVRSIRERVKADYEDRDNDHMDAATFARANTACRLTELALEQANDAKRRGAQDAIQELRAYDSDLAHELWRLLEGGRH
jgi:hypothetical protein